MDARVWERLRHVLLVALGLMLWTCGDLPGPCIKEPLVLYIGRISLCILPLQAIYTRSRKSGVANEGSKAKGARSVGDSILRQQDNNSSFRTLDLGGAFQIPFASSSMSSAPSGFTVEIEHSPEFQPSRTHCFSTRSSSTNKTDGPFDNSQF